MTKRPRIWIHRTRRFWFGLFGVILILASWMGSIGSTSHLKIQFSRKTSSDLITKIIWLGHDNGSFFGAFQAIDTSLKPFPFFKPGWLIQVGNYQIRTMLEITPARAIYFPIAYLLLIQIIAWITWMFIAERRELNRYSKELNSD